MQVIRFLPCIICFLLFVPRSAVAQVDPNLQIRIEPALPSLDVKPQLPRIEEVIVPRRQTITTTEPRKLSDSEREQRLLKILRRNKSSESIARLTRENLDAQFSKYRIGKFESRKVKRTIVRNEKIQIVQPRQTTVDAIFVSQAALDTNVFKSNLNRASDAVFTNAATLMVSIPVGALDGIAITSRASDVRYATYGAKDVELLYNSIAYSQVLSAVQGRNLASPNTTTIDSINYALASTTVFGSGFRPYQVELVTSSVIWSRRNIDLGNGVCGPSKNQAYCTAGNLSLEGNYTFSDIASLENFTAKLDGNLVWQTPVEGLVATAIGSIQGKHYTFSPEGRQDLILQATLRAAYKISSAASLSAEVLVTQQFSTVKALVWNGLTVFPALRAQVRF